MLAQSKIRTKTSLQDKLDKSSLLPDHHHHGEEHEGHEEHEHHHHGEYDPHIWLDPKMDQTFAKEIKDTLVKKTLNIKRI